MTRWVGEPSLQKVVAQQGKGIDNLARRPSINTSSIPLVAVQLHRSLGSPMSIGSGFTTTLVTWTQVIFDTSAFFSTAQPGRVTITKAGVYCVAGNGSFVGNPTGDRHASFKVNGANAIGVVATPAPANFSWAGYIIGVKQFAVGDYIELYIAQDSGGNLNTADMFMNVFAIGTIVA